MPPFVGGIDSKYTVLYIQKISGFNKDLTQLQPILSSSPSKTQTKLHLPIQEITAGPSFYVTWHKWFPYTIIWEIWLGIDLLIPHSPLPPLSKFKKIGNFWARNGLKALILYIYVWNTCKYIHENSLIFWATVDLPMRNGKPGCTSAWSRAST